jgi:predicted lipoprotein with Yx(FWY)xxD motif
MISKNDKLGDILTDDKGMTLYLYTKDTKNTSNCYDKCATNWPPLLTAGAAMAGTGADTTLLGTTTRKDGTTQVTYNGWPVYYWIKDKQAGDATGQDVGGVWFVLNAKGEQVKTPGAAAAPAAAGGTVMISKNDKLGDILTDAKGMTLYLYTKDTKNTSNCYDKCATNWPPLLTEGKPTAGTGADASLLGTTTRTDGKVQVTYDGRPLYYWIKDQKAGDATGQDVGGVWYVLNAKGEEVETPGGATSSNGAATAAPAAGKSVNATIKGFAFGPADLTVPVGTTVVWTNEDDMAHTVTATNGAFDSGDLDKGGTFSFTFTKAGTFDYICSIHPSMKGRITVTG